MSSRARSRHQLSTLLTDAYKNRVEIEDKIAMVCVFWIFTSYTDSSLSKAKRNRKESGNRYGKVIFILPSLLCSIELGF